MLAHEHAHLHQRHHLITALVDSIAAYLRWVPLIRAVADALPHYPEIAADDPGPPSRRNPGAGQRPRSSSANAPTPPCRSTPALSPCTPLVPNASATSSTPAPGWQAPCPPSRSPHTRSAWPPLLPSSICPTSRPPSPAAPSDPAGNQERTPNNE
ncbi:hypothetical protein LP422_10915 [Janibacter limosus]|uniref:Uncharacterized protein n=1 Tax=Janibacter limosus TaxID=53458 RepID=A0AC61U0I9_9MICO|nr:hypothetical protein [Janibacter limosus]UUZ43529.1 hypothetical protein LP422_10915 [Janibacter limosus]